MKKRVAEFGSPKDKMLNPPPDHINCKCAMPGEGANAIQIGGKHYKTKMEHWDFVAHNDLDYFQGQITKYVARWKKKDKKNGIQDLEKAQHFLAKYLELIHGGVISADK